LIVDVLEASGLAESRSAARRLITQGAVSVDGKRVSDIHEGVDPAAVFVIRAGRKMKRVVPAPGA
jgi:tyrosyl-tRNA synthetase